VAKRGDNNWAEIYRRLEHEGQDIYVLGNRKQAWASLKNQRERQAVKKWFRIVAAKSPDPYREGMMVIRIAEPRKRKAVGV
jgi:hypothetical protein